ncbi:elastin-like [Pseudopipra pipra]|uniref:elastin-like n=1 Tax=Pseudopipra pipra TaxID=415032 RepID=UPI003139AD81
MGGCRVYAPLPVPPPSPGLWAPQAQHLTQFWGGSIALCPGSGHSTRVAPRRSLGATLSSRGSVSSPRLGGSPRPSRDTAEAAPGLYCPSQTQQRKGRGEAGAGRSGGGAKRGRGSHTVSRAHTDGPPQALGGGGFGVRRKWEGRTWCLSSPPGGFRGVPETWAPPGAFEGFLGLPGGFSRLPGSTQGGFHGPRCLSTPRVWGSQSQDSPGVLGVAAPQSVKRLAKLCRSARRLSGGPCSGAGLGGGAPPGLGARAGLGARGGACGRGCRVVGGVCGPGGRGWAAGGGPWGRGWGTEGDLERRGWAVGGGAWGRGWGAVAGPGGRGCGEVGGALGLGWGDVAGPGGRGCGVVGGA